MSRYRYEPRVLWVVSVENELIAAFEIEEQAKELEEMLAKGKPERWVEVRPVTMKEIRTETRSIREDD